MTYRKQKTALHLLMLVLIIIITFFVFYGAMVHLREQLDEIRLNAVHQVEQIGRDYDLLLESNEKILAKDMSNVMSAIIRRISVSGKPDNFEELSAEKDIDFLIITDWEGNILSCTRDDILDNNINERIPEFQEYINTPGNQNKVIVDRVGLLFDHTRLYKAAWYIDPAQKRIYIIASDFRNFLEKTRSIGFSDYLLGDYFNSVTRSVMMVSDISLYYEQGTRIYTDSGEENLEMEELTASAYENIESQVFNNYESIVIPYHLNEMSNLNHLWLKISFDRDKIRQISMNLLLRTLFSFVILILVIYLGLYLFFKNLQSEREKLVYNVIESIRRNEFNDEVLEKGVFSKELEDGILELYERFTSQSQTSEREIEEKDSTIELLHKELDIEIRKGATLQRQLLQAQQSCEQMQRFDKVTGLPNRDTMRDYLYYERERAERDKRGFCLVILKLTNFPALVKIHGIDFGNYLLNKAGTKLRTLLRTQDQIGRWAENEYLMLLPLTTSEGVRLVINRIERLLKETEFYQEETRIRLEILCGGSVYVAGLTAEECLRQVQMAILEAENLGRNAIIE
ncbi:MAG: GGDEF domain-containing protein [Candidatus Cloacimonetes bacterium]|nr:GGDEF domain-containing protein [Candidatus Cloacimonadota bacterium]